MENNLDKIKPIEIEYIRRVIPQLLLNKLKLLKISNIQGIINTTVESFASMKGIGAKAVGLFENLKEDVIANPTKYYEIYLKNKESILPNSFYDNVNLIENLKLFITEYEELFENKRDIDIIFKKYGIGNDVFTLEEIGIFYDLTRERVRQIKEAEIKKINNLFIGDFNLKLNCRCKKEFISQISYLLSFIDNKSIVSLNEINSFFKDTNNYEIKKNDLNYLTFLLSVFGFDDFTYLNNFLYYKSEKFSNETIKQFLNTIQKILEINIYPLDSFSIVVKVKKVLKNPSVVNNDITNALEQIIEFEKIIYDKQECYQLRLDFLSSAGDMGMRILKENNQSMHFNDLVRIINQKLLKYGSDKLITPESLKAQFILSQYTVASGKTGYWSLKEWESDSKTILSLIKESLISKNSPLSYNEILDYISNKRSEIKKESIRTIVSLNKNELIKLVNNKFILKDWSQKYKNLLPKDSFTKKKSYNDIEIMKNIVGIFNKNSTNKLNSVTLREELKKKGITFKDSTYNAKLSRYPILDRPHINSRDLILKDEYKSILSQYSLKKEKESKIDIIKKEIIGILEKNNNLILQSRLIKMLQNDFGFPKGTVYKIIQTDYDFFKQYDDNLKTYVSFRKQDNEDVNVENEVLLIIKSGENDTTEFKSTLRWDLKENKINKDMEYEVIKTIAAFLNSSGGSLFIGVDDNNDILGLDNDFKTFQKKNIDGFQLHLLNVIHNYFSKDIHRFIKVFFHKIDSKTICEVKVIKSDTPRYIKRNDKSVFLIRASGSSHHLDIEEAVNYIKSHWQKI